MPRIKPYETRTNASGPIGGPKADASSFGYGDSLQYLGQNVQRAGEAVYKRIEQSEISDLNVQMSKAHAEGTESLKERLRTANPGDPTISQKFIEDYDSRMSKVEEGATTGGARRYFAQQNASLRSHFIESSIAGQSELAGIKATTDYTDSQKFRSSALLTDPSAFELTLQQHNDQVNKISEMYKLPPKKKEELLMRGKEDLAMTAIKGWINLNPDAAKKQLDSGMWDKHLDGLAKDKMYGEVRQAQIGAMADAERMRREQERVKAEKQMNTQNKFLDMLQKGTLDWATIRDSNLDAFGSGSKEQFIRLMEAGTSGGGKTDPGTFNALFTRINLPDGDPKKIVDENDLNQYVTGRKLSFDDLQKLRGEVQGKRTAEGGIESSLKSNLNEVAKSMLVKENPMMGIRDPQGQEQLLKWNAFFLTEYAEQRKKGKSAKDLLDPESPDYLGRQMRRFTRTPQQVMESMINFSKPQAPAPTASPSAITQPPRQPGESAADYLQRTGK